MAKRSDFFELLPARSLLLFHCAVFFVFAPTTLLLMSSFAEPRPIGTLLLTMLVSGAIAVCWAATFTLTRKGLYIAGIVLTTSAIMAMTGPARLTRFGIGPSSFSFEGVACVAAIVAGYVLFIRFIAGQGRTTLRLMTEMGLARRIHETLVPALRVKHERFEARGISMPSSEMGGDLIEVLPRKSDSASDLLVADVSGHGVQAGVVMGMVKASLRMHALHGGDLAGLAQDLNDVLESTTSPELCATLAGLRVEHVSGRVHWLVAGHHHVLHLRAGSREPVRLGHGGYPLGLLPARRYESRTIETTPGDLLALYTDGLNETMNAADEELGHEPIETAIASLANEPLERIESAVFELVARHGPQVDDRSLLLVRMR